MKIKRRENKNKTKQKEEEETSGEEILTTNCEKVKRYKRKFVFLRCFAGWSQGTGPKSRPQSSGYFFLNLGGLLLGRQILGCRIAKFSRMPLRPMRGSQAQVWKQERISWPQIICPVSPLQASTFLWTRMVLDPQRCFYIQN